MTAKQKKRKHIEEYPKVLLLCRLGIKKSREGGAPPFPTVKMHCIRVHRDVTRHLRRSARIV